MSDIDVSKIPADVMETAREWSNKLVLHDTHDLSFIENAPETLALLILTERAACAQYAFAMRWAPPLELQGTKESDEISKITTSWSHQVGMGILNR